MPKNLMSKVSPTFVKLRGRAREERGMAVVVAISMMTVSLLVTLSAFGAVWGDLPLARGDQDRKQAYSAAEAGISYYSYHLDQDNTYWLKCTNVPGPGGGQPNPVNQAWNGSGSDPRSWRTIPGSSAEYTIELLPAPGKSSCVQNDESSMLDPSNGTFKIRATGRAGGTKRSIVATYKRKGFLDYLYFTDYETLDPYAYHSASDQANAAAECIVYHYQGRDDDDCTEIRFISGDEVAGPLHTNDSMLVCGDPSFGRTSADAIESSGPNPGYWERGGCDADPNFVGDFEYGSQVLPLPLSNTSLSTVALPAYRYTGTTTIVLNGSSMTVTNNNLSPNTQTVALPSNGVIYVSNGTCGQSYKRKQQYSDPTGCANVYVSGTYSQDLTIGSQNDIIIRGNVTATNGALLGLIPNNFARIYHPVANWANNDTDCTNASGTMQNVRVDAAILALNHSFIVDNWYCGADLGTLTVNGAIAQKFRGPVGTGGDTSGSGYIKDYNYTDDLQHRDPPSFLSPTQSSWTIRRFVEQSPAR
ncbi:MAG TPA: pilus assembly PilX N-terminal domain-containing protein [Solirubrobacterales bacterium]|nr:pilus assembly PilX N-terminal domain-containing protein [Solirubrobacterales bacterium]